MIYFSIFFNVDHTVSDTNRQGFLPNPNPNVNLRGLPSGKIIPQPTEMSVFLFGGLFRVVNYKSLSNRRRCQINLLILNTLRENLFKVKKHGTETSRSRMCAMMRQALFKPVLGV